MLANVLLEYIAKNDEYNNIIALVRRPFGSSQNSMMILGKQTITNIFKQVADNTAGCMDINKAIFRERFEAAGRGC